MRGPLLIVAGIVTLVSTACSRPPAALPIELHRLAAPAAAYSTGPRLSTGTDGRLILSWMEPRDEVSALRYSEHSDGQWQAAKTVVDNVTMFVNWADLPSVVPLGDAHLAAHWLVKRPGGVYVYDIAFSQSFDDGRSWAPPIAPHTDGTPTQHGFVSIFPDGGKAGLIWLDGRNTSDDPSNYDVESGMTLRGALIDKQQTLHREPVIDELVCSCCPTDVAIAASGPVAVYRDRSEADVRDIRIAHMIDDEWHIGRRVAEDDWMIDACPVNGPKIVADGQFIAVAWFTASDDRGVVKLSLSNDAGHHFSAPIEVAAEQALGRVGLVHLGNNDVAVSWLARKGADGASLRMRYFDARGVSGASHTVSDAVRALSVPQMARLGDQLILVWTERHDDANRLVGARLSIADLWQAR